jgi:PAS domain S-box-containing protein
VLLSWPLINMETENEDPLPDQISPILTPDFQALFESGPGLYLVLTPASTIVAVSEAYLKSTMTRRDEILGRHLFDVFPDNPGDPTTTAVANTRASLNRVLQHRVPDTMAVQKHDIHRPESEGGGFEERYWSPVNSPVLGAKGEVVYIIHRVEDVTQRKRAEEELYKQTGILKSVLTNIGEGVVVADMEGKFLIWNPAAERLVGRGPTTEPMNKWSDHYRVFLPDQITPYPADQLPLARAIRGESVTGDEQFLRRSDIPDGIWLSVSGRPLVDESGVQRGGVVAFSDITARKREEEALYRLAAIVEFSGDAIIGKTLDGIVTSWNKGAERLYGYTAEEVMGKPITMLLPPDRMEEEARIIALLRQGELLDQFETVRQRKDGQLVDVSLAISPIRDAVGAIIGVSKIARDITERKRAEEAVKESEQRLNLALDSAQMGAWELNLTNDTAIRSLKHDQIFGYPSLQPEWTSKIFLAHVVREDRDLAKKRLDEAFATGHFNMECRIMWPDQSLHWIATQGRVYRNHSGDPVRMIGVVTDITERKRAEVAFRKSEEKHRTLFDSIDEGVCTIEMLFDGNDKPIDYRFLEVNPAFEKQTGIQNARGRRMREIAPLHEEYWFEIYGKIALTGEPAHFEKRAAQLDRWYDVSAIRVGEPQERQVAIVFNNITERKRAEEALRRAHDELEVRVQERTVEILKKTHDLETLLFVTSHDLREPLRSIENFSRMVHDRYATQLDDKGRDFLRRVVRAAQRMDQLMTDILALSRAQRMELPAEEVEGESIVREALRQLEDKIKETGATVRVVEDLPRLQGNGTWATQGVYNLIANALKFSRNGAAPDVEIASYQPTVEDGPVVGIVVRDRGPGVAPAQAERIFQLFQRAVGREVEGTGAGLAIVRQVAERHGGRAWVQPREGGGSEFILTFGVTNRSERKEAP